jgi:hypothetical protein
MGYMQGCNRKNCNRGNPCSNCEMRFATVMRGDEDPYEVEKRRKSRGGWSPRTVGSIGDSEVTFKQGTGSNEGHTLIADGQPSGRAFDRRGEHDHYGPKREGDGRVDSDRGHYTGPGH